MVLELMLKVNQDDAGAVHSGKTIQRVLFELNLEETRDFVNSL